MPIKRLPVSKPLAEHIAATTMMLQDHIIENCKYLEEKLPFHRGALRGLW